MIIVSSLFLSQACLGIVFNLREDTHTLQDNRATWLSWWFDRLSSQIFLEWLNLLQHFEYLGLTQSVRFIKHLLVW